MFLISECGGWMCLIWTRCQKVLFRPPTLRQQKCLISHNQSRGKWWTRDHYAAISEIVLIIVSKHIVYTKLPAPRHVESCYFIFLMKIGTETYIKSNLSQPSSRWTLQLTRSNHKFQPNITFVCDVSARCLITMSSCKTMICSLFLFNIIINLLLCADDYVQFMK